MANFQVRDGYGSVITIQSSTFGSAERQIVGASIIGTFPVTISGNPSISGTVGASIIGAVNVNPSSVFVLNPVSTLSVNPNPSSVFVLNPVSILAVNPNPSSVWVLNPVSTLGVTQVGAWNTSVIGAIAPTGTVTSVVSATSTAGLLASNSSRRGATVSNYSGTSILVKLGLMSGVTDHTVVMQDTDYYEVPFNYSGVIQHFSSSVAGFIRITEFT